MSLAEASNCIPVALSTVILPRERSRSPLLRSDQGIRCTLVLVIRTCLLFGACFLSSPLLVLYTTFANMFASLTCFLLFLIIISNKHTYSRLSYRVTCFFLTDTFLKIFSLLLSFKKTFIAYLTCYTFAKTIAS